MADVIPLGSEWSAGSDPVYSRMIDGVSPADVLADDEQANRANIKVVEVEVEKLPEVKFEEKKKYKAPNKGEFPCRGCGRVFAYKVARAGHERSCKVAMNTKITEA